MTPRAAPDAGPSVSLAHRSVALRLAWPLPALAAWSAGWLAATGAGAAAWSAGTQFAAGTAVGLVLAATQGSAWRRGIAAAGFPLSWLLMTGPAGAVQAAAWLLALVPLALLYPLRAWRDAPFFPTPAAALLGLEQVVRPAPGRILDVGCGLGHGLVALHRLWPAASLHGVERSWPIAWLARRRLRRVGGAEIAAGDMWARSWAGCDLIYVFQRPETMARAWAKAGAEAADGTWFASLEFAVPGVTPEAVVDAGVGRPVHVYRVRAAGRPPRRSTGAAPGR